MSSDGGYTRLRRIRAWIFAFTHRTPVSASFLIRDSDNRTQPQPGERSHRWCRPRPRSKGFGVNTETTADSALNTSSATIQQQRVNFVPTSSIAKLLQVDGRLEDTSQDFLLLVRARPRSTRNDRRRLESPLHRGLASRAAGEFKAHEQQPGERRGSCL